MENIIFGPLCLYDLDIHGVATSHFTPSRLETRRADRFPTHPPTNRHQGLRLPAEARAQPHRRRAAPGQGAFDYPKVA